jgi:hypothetical protein
MKYILCVAIVLLFGINYNSNAVTLQVENIPGHFVSGSGGSGSPGDPPPEIKTALWSQGAGSGTCDINGISTNTDPITGNTTVTVITNPNSFNVSNFQDLMDWITTP